MQRLLAGLIALWDRLTERVSGRAPGWAALRRRHLALQPDCQACGSRKGCVPHHVVPVHLYPEGELEPSNLLTLCPDDHFTFGHLKNWAAFNPRVRSDCIEYRQRVRTRPTTWRIP